MMALTCSAVAKNVRTNANRKIAGSSGSDAVTRMEGVNSNPLYKKSTMHVVDDALYS
jgi:hypothetical protein